ncbi:hypothetical protein LCGC14_2124790, partial [marine sediment metagenome]
VLKKHWPDVPIIGDIKDATKETIMAYTQSYRESRRQPKDRERERIEQIADMEGGIITFKRTSVEDCILIRKADWQALKGE